MHKKKQISLHRSEDFFLKKLLNEVPLKEIMTSPVETVRADAPFSEVAKCIIVDRIRHVPIVNSEKQLIGLISQRDLYKIQSPRKNEGGEWFYDMEALDEYIIVDVMVHDPFTLGPEEPIAKAVLAMVDHSYGCVIIVDEKKIPVGIVTRADILCIAAQILRE